jgi:hypothetical protein
VFNLSSEEKVAYTRAMKFFALETNIEKIKEQFLTSGESEIFTVRQHIMGLVSKIIWHIILTVFLGAFAIYLINLSILPSFPIVITTFIGWFLFIGIPLIGAYIDWRYDFLFLTTDKFIIVEQFSIFQKSITPISLENLGDVVAKTQWLHLFNFGIIEVALKEGNGPSIILKFMPNAEQIVAKVAEQITLYQRRKDFIVPYRHQGE